MIKENTWTSQGLGWGTYDQSFDQQEGDCDWEFYQNDKNKGEQFPKENIKRVSYHRECEWKNQLVGLKQTSLSLKMCILPNHFCQKDNIVNMAKDFLSNKIYVSVQKS